MTTTQDELFDDEKSDDEVSESTWLSWIPDNSEVGAMIRDFDWGATAIGPLDSWPTALRVPVAMCLNTNFPVLVVWGPDLIKIYNDGYARMVGPSKHPSALGVPAAEVWPEIWDTIGPMFDDVVSTGRPTWNENQLLEIDRRGYIEECYFTFSYSPLYDGDSIAGVLDVSVETTAEVVAQRRLVCMTEVTTALLDSETPVDACVAAVSALRTCSDDVINAEIQVCVDGTILPVASNRRRNLAAIAPTVLRTAVDQGSMVVLGADDVELPADHVVIPFGADPDGEMTGVLVASLNRRRPFDDDFRSFVQVLARTIGSGVDQARRRVEQLGEHRHINETLQQAMLSPVRDTETIAARYVPAATNLSVGGDWYDVIDLDERRRAIVVGDCVGHGLDAATAMSQLRSASRALLLEEDADAAQTIRSLDAFAKSVPGAKCASVVCAIVDRRSGLIEYCRAGHPPPLVVGKSGVTWLSESGGTGLGIDADQQRSTAVHRLNRDDLIVMYTDGLVERRGRAIDDGLDQLADAVTGLEAQPVGAIADGLLREMVGDDATDDIVVVVKRFAG